MAHEVESLFSYREVPWHGLGTLVNEAPNAADALRLAGLEWSVRSEPLFLANGQEVVGYRANVRDRDGEILGVVSDDYRVVQNHEAFEWVDHLLGFGVRYETAGSLRRGKRVFMCARLPEPYQIAGDATDVFITFSNAHDGTAALRVAISPVRVVCMNTLNAAFRRANRQWSARHTQSIQEQMAEARRTLQLTEGYVQQLAAEADRLLAIPFHDGDWTKLVNHLFPTPKADEPPLSEAQETRRLALQASWYLRDDLGNIRDTAWGALNAVAWYTTHVDPVPVTARRSERAMTEFLDGSPLLAQAYGWIQDQVS